MRNINQFEMERVTLPAMAAKYQALLGGAHYPAPYFLVLHRPGARWAGRCWNMMAMGKTSRIEIQQTLTADLHTLERIVAHEVIHHMENMKYGYTARFMNHGWQFREMMQQINAVMGKDFVTVRSAEDWKRGATPRPIVVVMYRRSENEVPLVAWFQRATIKVSHVLDVIRQRPGHQVRLAMTDDARISTFFPRATGSKWGVPGESIRPFVQALWDCPKTKTITADPIT